MRAGDAEWWKLRTLKLTVFSSGGISLISSKDTPVPKTFQALVENIHLLNLHHACWCAVNPELPVCSLVWNSMCPLKIQTTLAYIPDEW